MDKIVLGFIVDLLFLKGIICFEEFDDIMESKNIHDLDNVREKIMRGEYNLYKKGEGYIRTANDKRGGK